MTNTAPLTGAELIEHGWPEGPLIGQALRLAASLTAAGVSADDVRALLAQVHADPVATLAGQPAFELAQNLVAFRRLRDAPRVVGQPGPTGEVVVRDEPLAAPVWGEELIDAGAIRQLRDAMRLPVTAAGALMPDAHIGYGVPIGAVVALDGAVAPYMVGVDIACRMMLTVYPADALAFLDERRDALRTAMRAESRFGIGASFRPGERREHAVLDDPDWSATRQLADLQSKAWAQLGTSGTGNHFVDAGRLTVDAAGAEALGVAEGEYFALLTHSGSRGVGAQIASRFSKLAREATPLPRELRNLAWLELASDLGEAYWTSMELAGRFASACHHVLHDALGAALGLERVAAVENHHNFAWKEAVQLPGESEARELVVHRKGATPAHAGVLGVVPGSQGHPSYVVRGLGAPAALHSASHGAGRQMGRKQAIRELSAEQRNAWLAERGVELLAGGLDEAPQAYKDIDEVLALQGDLAEPVARFDPAVVLMASDGKSEG